MAIVVVPTPAGRFAIEGNDRYVTEIYQPFSGQRGTAGAVPQAVRRLAEQIERYAAGHHVRFSLSLLAWPSTSAFTRSVWDGLARVPYGTVITYGELALDIGRPRAARAVGNALNQNPFPIVVPCHRVVSSTDIGGYGGGTRVKRQLLALEGVYYDADGRPSTRTVATT